MDKTDCAACEKGEVLLLAREFRRIASGQRQDVGAKLLRPLLAAASWPYGWIVNYRNRRFDSGKTQQHGVDVPVICVGNLTVGGTGKTPMVAYLCHWFRAHNVRVAIVSRGYGAAEGKQNDEARELSSRLPDVPHIQNPDRVAAARVAADELEMQVIILDDGFQHRRLKRDLDLVLIDASEPFGFQRLLPRGLLREPISGLNRAGLVALSRADLVSPERRVELRERVAQVAPDAKWIELAHSPSQLVAGEESEPVDSLEGKRVLAFCGLGNPEAFRRSLVNCGADVVRFLEFPDHHEYTRDDMNAICDSVCEHQPESIVCTQKDMVKIELDQLDGVPLRALLVEQRILHGEEQLHAKLTEILHRIRASEEAN